MLKHIFLILSCVSSLSLLSQTNNMGIGTQNPDASAKLEIQSNEQGFLAPRMTDAERIAIASPANGLLVYDTSDSAFWFFDGNLWKPLDAEIPPFPVITSDILVTFLSQSGLAGTGPTIIGSNVLPASSCNANGQWFNLHAFGDISSDSATITFKMGNNELIFPTNQQGNWEVNIKVYRETSTSLKATGTLLMSGFSATSRVTGVQNFDAAIPLQILGAQEPAVLNGLSLEGFSVSRTR